MKMKKMLMCAVAGAVAISCANANDMDVNQIKTACQNSDKTLWVERNQVCIPNDPCSMDKYAQYCNRIFRKVETRGVGYKILIDIYAKTHNLSCKSPVSQKAKLFGDDYVVCDGTDVMVFQFDDIKNGKVAEFMVMPLTQLLESATYANQMNSYLCMAAGGDSARSDSHLCYGITSNSCSVIANVMSEYGFNYEDIKWDDSNKVCHVNTSKTGGVLDDTKF